MQANLIGFCTWSGDVLDSREVFPHDAGEFRCVFAVDWRQPPAPFAEMRFPEWVPGAQCSNGLLAVSVRADRLPVDLWRDWQGLVAAIQQILQAV